LLRRITITITTTIITLRSSWMFLPHTSKLVWATLEGRVSGPRSDVARGC
jgi:hypothetical protein